MLEQKAPESAIEFPAVAPGRISPTDVSQFIRLEQCERYLRLRLHERANGDDFMRDHGVTPQAIPPILTRSGADFETQVMRAVSTRFTSIDVAREVAGKGHHQPDNERVATLARDLEIGQTLVLFQPRLDVVVDGWQIRGDIDMLRLERGADGLLRVLIADMKSSTSPKIEHRLQVAFYQRMLTELFKEQEIECAEMRIGILYRGPAGESEPVQPAEAAVLDAQRRQAEQAFAVTAGLLEVVEDARPYLDAVSDLVTGAASTAARVGESPFDDLKFHLTYKCDGCLYNEFCLKWSAERDDLSLLPYLTAQDKGALQGAGVHTVRALSALKKLPMASANGTSGGLSPATAGANGSSARDLIPAPGTETLLGRLSTTWPVGPRLDELIYRAQRYRAYKGDKIESLSYIPSKGYGSLPFAGPEQNPNLVRIYIDAQHDYLNDRVYLLGALLVGCEAGEPMQGRTRSIVRLAERPPIAEQIEQVLFVAWIRDLLAMLLEVAAPDADGQATAPIHLIFYNRFDQRVLLDGLARHASAIMGATALYDLITQIAAYDSPLVTYLDEEIREHKNYPMLCQSLQAVAAYLKFDWNTPEPYRRIFRARMFDFWRKLDVVEGEEIPWYTGRSRFNSQIPLEFAYAAWHDLPPPPARGQDSFEPYREATAALVEGFHARRLEAMEYIAADFKGNKQTQKTAFDLQVLTTFDGRARTLAHALDEFVTIERHVELAEWKAARLPPPERRALAGDTLIASYHDEDQTVETRAENAENKRKQARKQELATQGVELSMAEKKELRWSQDGLRVRLRLQAPPNCTLPEMLALTTLREDSWVVLRQRWEVDSRLPEAEQTPFTPTPKQLLYGSRADIVSLRLEHEEAGAGWVEVEMLTGFGGPTMRPYVFNGRDEPFVDGVSYTLDEDPNNIYGYWCSKVTEGLCANGANTLYNRLLDMPAARVTWPEAAAAGQARFLAGLDVLQRAGAADPFEPGKRDFIGTLGDSAALLVQGPPGTGKSYTTAYALLARLQGALAAGIDFRVFVTCKTHAATDVLLGKIVDEQARLRGLRETHPAAFAEYIDARVLEVPLFRVQPKHEVPDRVQPLYKNKEDRPEGAASPIRAIQSERWCVVAATPGGTYGIAKEEWSKSLFGHELCDCLVLDEASQMSLPEAAMAALLLRPGGQLIVVGDHRQMPPIVKHEWSTERRRTFQQYRAYESLFATLLPLATATIKFEESFRLHRDMAAFLRREIYQQDGIPFFSRRRQLLIAHEHDDPFLAAVLAPEYSLITVEHEESASQLRNPYEQELITPILEVLAGAYGLDALHGLGVVVPHRAQRAALQEAVPAITVRDPVTNTIRLSAVDTVERFQGGEREVILVSATESDREYLLLNGEFLLDPRRLTVAMSRAKHKMVLVAAHSVFSMFSADEETFMHAQLWKNLLRYTCTELLWSGERGGTRVKVWGNRPDYSPQLS